MKRVVVGICKGLMAIIYGICKLFPVRQNKVLFLSRQHSVQSQDFKLLEQALRAQAPGELEIVGIYNRIGPGMKSKLSFVKDTIRSLYHLATTRVAVLDTHWPAVSLTKPRKSLTVIQMWHSLGKIKQSGLIALGRPGGQPKDWGKLMNMHGGYDYVIAGAPFWNPFYCDSFPITEDQILNYGLPSLDVLSAPRPELQEQIYAAYPQLKDATVVMYAPTFRRYMQPEHAEFLAALGKQGYQLVVKSHPNQKIDAHGALTCPEFKSNELLSVADYIITDYSAIALEAAAVGVPTLYYLFDYEEYRSKNGLNIDIPAEMPGCVFFDAESLVEALNSFVEGDYPMETFKAYQDKFLLPDRGHSARDFADFILARLNFDTIDAHKK